ncbi:phosphoglycerate mutase [Gloeomargarita lithophora Alchichica-D10]|uniref:Phosphoglycerate mutase n=2 Tax=Gloeomargarita TaxID=1188227 RepID=A0A1J0A909_9CYAN|nr:phosphoglycerate mutase [Gloeomargarita lithophora Alchichica-D10]
MHRQDTDNPDWRAQAVYPDDPDLSPQGQEQAQQLAHFLAPHALDYIFTSPFLRAMRTAWPVAQRQKLTLKIEPGLGEFLNPDWFAAPPKRHALTWLQQEFPLIDPDYRPRFNPQFPEEDLAAIARASRVAAQLVQEFTGNVLMVGHGVSVWGATWGVLPDQPEIQCDLGSLIEIQQTPTGWQLVRTGATDYLSL